MIRLDVSDHAVLRFLERVQGVDVAAVRRHIAQASQNAAQLGASGVRVQGVTFKIDHGPYYPVVTTTLVKRPPRHQGAPQRDEED